jgi:hypothetical protein
VTSFPFGSPMGMAALDELEFQVEQWDSTPVRLIIAAHLLIARAAFTEAVRLMPAMPLYLRIARG